MNDETVCPLCGQHHFEENDDFEECPVCGWVNDGVQRADPDYRGGLRAFAGDVRASLAKALFVCSHSSVGRVPALQAGCRGFEPR